MRTPKILPKQDKEIEQLHNAGMSYYKIASKLKLNPVSVREHGRNYRKSHGLPIKQVTNIKSQIPKGQNPVNRMYIEELRKWLLNSDDIPGFLNMYHLNEKTKPSHTSVYTWFKQMKGISYSEAMALKAKQKQSERKYRNWKPLYKKIRKEYKNGVKLEELMEEYDAPKGTIATILCRVPSLMKKGKGGTLRKSSIVAREDSPNWKPTKIPKDVRKAMNKVVKPLSEPIKKDLFKTYKIQPPPPSQPKPKPAPLTRLEKAKQEAEIELIHHQSREARARAELAEIELEAKLKKLRDFEKENERD